MIIYLRCIRATDSGLIINYIYKTEDRGNHQFIHVYIERMDAWLGFFRWRFDEVYYP